MYNQAFDKMYCETNIACCHALLNFFHYWNMYSAAYTYSAAYQMH